MKRSLASLLAILSVVTAHAGSFGGPTSLNTSTQTGAVGTYQATARGKGLSGIFRFNYNSNGNPVATTANPSTYVFFIDGMLVTGTVDASLMSSKIAGIFESGTVATVSPFLFGYEVPGGSFTANINTSSANYFFKGKGNIQSYSQAVAVAPVLQTDIPWIAKNRDFKVSGQRTSTTLD
ncbi:MAG: hypothetical protein WCH98_19605 [Verrucomicrobiota bacterium]